MAQKMNLQDQYLNAARKQRVEVSIFLVNGIKLNGIIRSFDNYIVLLASKAGNQMVYKHAISTVVPTAVFKFEPVLSDEPQIDHA